MVHAPLRTNALVIVDGKMLTAISQSAKTVLLLVHALLQMSVTVLMAIMAMHVTINVHFPARMVELALAKTRATAPTLDSKERFVKLRFVVLVLTEPVLVQKLANVLLAGLALIVTFLFVIQDVQVVHGVSLQILVNVTMAGKAQIVSPKYATKAVLMESLIL